MKPRYDLFARLLDKYGMKVADVAKATEIHPTIFSDWKRGKSSPKQDKIKVIADYFSVNWNDFYEEDPGEPRYYINDETAQLAQELFDDRDLRVLFDAARDSRPEDLQMAADLLRRLKETNKDG